MLSIQALSLAYGRAAVLREITLEVLEGRVAVILGANGSGKTTLLRAISGLARPTGGHITYRDRPIVGKDASEIVRMGIAHVPQGRELFPQLTVEENLRMGAYALGRRHPAPWSYVFELFPMLRDRKSQLAGSLSGGEQHMVAIARALMCRPSLLMMDEPSAGLAPVVVDRLVQLIRQVSHQDGTTVLLVEQNAYLALAVADSAHVLRLGQFTFSGLPDALNSGRTLHEAYFGRGES